MVKFEILGKRFDSLFDSAMKRMDKAFENFDSVFDTVNRNLLKKNDEIVPVFQNEGLSSIAEEDDKFIISIPSNGAKKEDVEVTVDDDTVQITVHTKKEDEDGRVITYNSVIKRSIPHNAEVKGIKANLKGDNIIVTIPKTKQD